ncbi:sensor histidine kinase [Variovorax sp. RT4R15]|uniref:sensor histidine kinase n=1 Tax=Variovorax sp. RT4R15 TaxID=3443737 RepID=UPI003F47346A
MFANKDPEFDAVNINEATREVLALSVGDLQRNQVLLRTDLGSRLPNVRGDRIQLQQVFLNLVLNAIEAMADVVGRPKHLVVRTRLDGDANAYLSVTDVGVGFQPGDEEKIFRAFYTTKKTGMGIGLSVSSTIVQRHGGRIWATPIQDGPGATFSVSVPVPRSGSWGWSTRSRPP